MSPVQVVIAPDSFKGSLSAIKVAQALARGLAQSGQPVRSTVAPMADGGEGTLDCVAASCAGDWQQTTIEAIHGQSINARWFLMHGHTAVIECAEVLGLPLIEQTTDAPGLRRRSSAALGHLITCALNADAEELVIGLGGSACNDAGLGLMVALGARALDRDGQMLAPSMDALLALDRLDLSGLDPRLIDLPIRVLCDVDNPLLGEQGASRIYGPQKGLTNDDIQAVETAFGRLAQLLDVQDKTSLAGSGAAGGLGFALAALGGNLESGAEALMSLTGLRESMDEADCVLTGEGRSDRQTLAGKLPLAVARAARPTPTYLICGAIADDARSALEQEFAMCHTLVECSGSLAAALAEPSRWLEQIATELAADIVALGAP
ncbi:MAG: glycerate kinase [Salinisphaera sp.]|jgi:glycerate kinase|nr:glycerate kinase [Salinisphaera sp.]